MNDHLHYPFPLSTLGGIHWLWQRSLSSYKDPRDPTVRHKFIRIQSDYEPLGVLHRSKQQRKDSIEYDCVRLQVQD